MRNDLASLNLLLRHEGPGPWLSRPERRLLKFAIDTLGVPLSSFLLAGLGEEEKARSWLFSVTFEDDGGVPRRRDIRVEADERPDVVTSLPGRKEPLILIALLWLLMQEHDSSVTRLNYSRGGVLRMLGWDETPESLHTVDEAVDRYADLSYRWTLSADELSEKNLNKLRGWTRLVTGCGYDDQEEGDDELAHRTSNHVSFSAEFIRELITRSVFDVRWDKVHGMAQTTETILSPEKGL